jgi:beta-lactamase regulating signal transducer with metallopeptidase domain
MILHEPSIELAALAFVRVTVVFAAGAALSWTLRGKSAAFRHAVWLLTIAGCIEVVAISPFVSPVRVQVIKAPVAIDATLNRLGLMNRMTEPRGIARQRSGQTPSRPVSGQSALGVRDDMDGPAPQDGKPVDIVLVAWLLGGILVLLFRGLGALSCSRLLRRAQPMTDPRWNSMLDDLARQSGLNSRPMIALSEEISGPVVIGVLRPAILMPVTALAWIDARVRVALLHELAHIRRRDPAARFAATIGCAVCWFHPGVWVAARRMKWESEAACDDAVITTGEDSTEYASQLVAIARNALGIRMSNLGSIGMASYRCIDARLKRILEAGISRTAPGRRQSITAALMMALFLIPVAVIRPALATETVSAAARSDTTFVQTVPAGNANVLSLAIATTANVEVTGWDRDDVEVTAYLNGVESTDMPRLVNSNAGDISFRLPRLNGADAAGHHYLLAFRVPRRFSVVAEGKGGGDMRVAGIRGLLSSSRSAGGAELYRLSDAVKLSTGNGNIGADVLAGGSDVRTSKGEIKINQTTGPISARTSRGSIDANSVAGALTAQTSSGDITVAFAPQYTANEGSRLTSAHGDVTATVPKTMSATFVFEAELDEKSSGSSQVQSDWPVRLERVSAWSPARGRTLQMLRGSVDVGGGGRVITLAASNGRIYLKRADR